MAPILNQPSVLTPRGDLVVEPSYQFGYSSADRVALIGCTVILAILIGPIDARQVKTTTQTRDTPGATVMVRCRRHADIAVATLVPIYWHGQIGFPGGVLASTGVVR